MSTTASDNGYNRLLEEIFSRYPSVASKGFAPDSYKPGLDNMRAFDRALGYPSSRLRCIHVAGTNGKGSVSSMLASALASQGLSVGLYTSPHLLDFRERARIVTDSGFELVDRGFVYDFLTSWRGLFDELGLSFFEITTGLAFSWFAAREVDVAVIEVGLGGRLDSTNIITPELSVITSIGLDHCALLGDTIEKIAVEKAGIFKPGVPALVWGHDEILDPVFSEQASTKHCPLFYASDFDTVSPKGLDLNGEYQIINYQTTIAALKLLSIEPSLEAIAHTAARTGFRGRWEKLHSSPDVICDIGHNPPALRWNFSQLERLLADGTYDRLIIVYGIMADKDLAGISPLMPHDADYIFVTPDTPRALPASEILSAFRRLRPTTETSSATAGDTAAKPHATDLRATAAGSVADALAGLLFGTQQGATPEASTMDSRTLIYVGGSTYVVCEAQKFFEEHFKNGR